VAEIAWQAKCMASQVPDSGLAETQLFTKLNLSCSPGASIVGVDPVLNQVPAKKTIIRMSRTEANGHAERQS
jgi:hypothetical protein